MKNKLKKILLTIAGYFVLCGLHSQNVSLNMLVLNSGIVPLAGNGTLKATINATTGTSGQVNPVPAGKINVSITVPPSLFIAATQNNIPAGWTIRNNDGTVINICNSTATIPVNTAFEILITLQGVIATSGSPTMSGQISFKTNCTGPGSLTGDNLSDNSGQAGYTVTGVVPVKLTDFNAVLANCQPALNWVTENEINSSRFEIERSGENAPGWVYVATVAAGGNSAEKNKYSFVDNSAGISTEKILYRLKIFDRDGHYKYSAILPVYINCKTKQLHVYPNPSQNGILYAGITGLNKPAEVNLVSATGQVVLKLNVTNGTNKLDVSHIGNGQYFLQVNFENGVSEKVKVLIIR